MKILAIASKLPYPLTDGGRICMYQSVYGLASLGHEVHVVAIEDRVQESGRLQEFCHVHLQRYRPLPRAVGALATLLSSRPYTQWLRDLRKVYRYLDRLQHREKFDVVYADHTHMACYGSYMKLQHGLPYVLRTHNIEHEISLRYANTVQSRAMRAYLHLQSRRWQRFEAAQLRTADACAAITERDMMAMKRLVPGVNVSVIPACVDLSLFPFVPVGAREEQSLIAVGNMEWAPNHDAVLWFNNAIFRRVIAETPGVICHIVGNNPSAGPLRSSQNLRLHGKVDSIRTFYDRVTIGLIPLRVGGGMRVKMLEMMSSGLPIVSTGLGAEGNAAVAGEHYLRADDPASFAAAITLLLRNRAERERLSLAARNLVAEQYDVRQVGPKLERLLLFAKHGTLLE